ncbi:MAG: hypothetical protein AAFR37_04495 [Cyanobacteria bacterium J06628_3]
MDRKDKKLLLLVVSCSVAGVVLGGTSSWAESTMCMNANELTSECLTQDPVSKTLQGMSTGLLAGAGAAFGAAFTLRNEDEQC